MPFTAGVGREQFLVLGLSVLTACVLGIHANQNTTSSTACQNVSGVTYPAACPRSNDPDSFTRCCETNGKPNCCRPLQRGIRLTSSCGSKFAEHGIPYCPMPNDPAENSTCCSMTTWPMGFKTTEYYCCHADFGYATIPIIIISVVVVVVVFALLGCGFCAYRIIRARRRNAGQTGYTVQE